MTTDTVVDPQILELDRYLTDVWLDAAGRPREEAAEAAATEQRPRLIAEQLRDRGFCVAVLLPPR